MSGSCRPMLLGPYAESCAYNKFPIGAVLQWALPTAIPSSCNGSEGGVRLLELGSGTGQHAIYFTHPPFIGGNCTPPTADSLLQWSETHLASMEIHEDRLFDKFHGFDSTLLSTWQTSDLEEELDGIRANFESAQQQWGWDRSRCPDPLPLSFTSSDEVFASVATPCQYDVVFTANTLHIAPWSAGLTLLREKLPIVLRRGGIFMCYGPFNYNGSYSSESNRRFDQWLKVHKSPQSAIRDFEAVRDALVSSTPEGFELVHDVPMPENNRFLMFRRL